MTTAATTWLIDNTAAMAVLASLAKGTTNDAMMPIIARTTNEIRGCLPIAGTQPPARCPPPHAERLFRFTVAMSDAMDEASQAAGSPEPAALCWHTCTDRARGPASPCGSVIGRRARRPSRVEVPATLRSGRVAGERCQRPT
jgi:hypothetical protein